MSAAPLRWLRRPAIWLSPLGALALSQASAQDADPGICASGAQVKAAYCGFFKRYSTDDSAPLDYRIGDSLGVTSSAETRSIALIIAIDTYPNLPPPEKDLSAAGVDLARLQDYLINNQKFDEVIILRNEEATAANIDYFLYNYLPHRGEDFAGKARLLIAYSGHGRPDTDTRSKDAAFLLADADSEDSTAAYRMTALAERVKVLSDKYFHVLTLINACFGGNTFVSVGGGNGNDETSPGSYVITAGSKQRTVLAFDPEKGSLFFDLIVTGLEKGLADKEERAPVIADGGGDNSTLERGLTGTLTVFYYLDKAYRAINRAKAHEPGFEKLSPPWYGAAEAEGPAMGGFFFLDGNGVATVPLPAQARARSPSDTQVASQTPFRGLLRTADRIERDVPVGSQSAALQSAVRIPVGPVSSIMGRPDLKIFKAPRVYPVHGYDVSSEEGRIDWKTLAANSPPNFIYARALGWRGPDKTFGDRWSNIAALRIDRGAYLKFNFCQTADAQLAAFTQMVGVDAADLPVAMELVEPQARDDPRQAKCYQASGKPAAQAAMLKLAAGIRDHYHKVPLIFGNRYNLTLFTDARFESYMLWLATYGAPAGGGALQLPGNNPWTLWQYTATLKVKGIGSGVTGNVFFGTRTQYAAFKQGQSNVALSAVRTPAEPR